MSKPPRRARKTKKPDAPAPKTKAPMNRVFAHVRRFVIRGTLALIPIALPAFAVYLLYGFIDRRLLVLVHKTFGISFPGMGIVLLLVILYLFGLVVSNFFGRQLLQGLESLTERIPIINTAYRIGKQLSGTLSLPEKQIFRRPILVPYAAPGTWQVGFVTGTVRSERDGVELLKVYVPTPPNPTSGFVYFMKESDTRDPGWTVEEAMQCILSGGLIGSPTIR
ncbi:MAG TPA: DUF502 domain-containing protein [Candidatus Krumholzibacteria bacterium]|nr:DUF502 domain-containing protein [Candidatus Krumholzibacteria bacterium]